MWRTRFAEPTLKLIYSAHHLLTRHNRTGTHCVCVFGIIFFLNSTLLSLVVCLLLCCGVEYRRVPGSSMTERHASPGVVDCAEYNSRQCLRHIEWALHTFTHWLVCVFAVTCTHYKKKTNTLTGICRWWVMEIECGILLCRSRTTSCVENTLHIVCSSFVNVLTFIDSFNFLYLQTPYPLKNV